MIENKTITTEDLVKQADETFMNLIKSNKYKEILSAISNLNSFSINNLMLILSQNPKATCVNSMKVWNYYHRNINKGEKSIKIIAPVKESKEVQILDEQGNVVATQDKQEYGFQINHVFDVSQTSGNPMYQFQCNAEIIKDNFKVLKDALERIPRGWTFEYQEIPDDTGLKSYRNLTEFKVIVKLGMSYEDTLSALVKEISDILSNSRMRNNFKGLTDKDYAAINKLESESIAFTVSNRLGLPLNDFNFDDVAKFSDDNIKKFKYNTELIRSVSYQMLSIIEPALQTHLREQKRAISSDNGQTKANTQDNQEQAVAGEIKSNKSQNKNEVEQC